MSSLLPTLPGCVSGIVGRDPWRVQCAKCATVVTADDRPGALYGVVRDLHFHHRLPAPWDERRLCRDCRLSFGCDCWDCASERRPA